MSLVEDTISTVNELCVRNAILTGSPIISKACPKILKASSAPGSWFCTHHHKNSILAAKPLPLHTSQNTMRMKSEDNISFPNIRDLCTIFVTSQALP